jgi:hypothetical protein
MDTTFKVNLVLTEPRREELFPIQEQGIRPIACRFEKPAAVVFAERLVAPVSGAPSPSFIP